MSLTTTLAQGKLILSSMFSMLSIAGLRQVYQGLFSMEGQPKSTAASSPLSQFQQCPECMTSLGAANELYTGIAVCDNCGYHFVWSASDRVNHLADPGTFRPISRIDRLKVRISLAIISKLSTFVPHNGGRENSLVS